MLKSEIPRYTIGEFVCLAPKVYCFSFIAYHVNKIKSEMKIHFEYFFNTRDVIINLYTDISSAIFEFEYGFDQIEYAVSSLNIKLEGYHNVKIKCVKFQEQEIPQSSSFYNKDIL